MKKIYLIILAILCLCSLCAFAAVNDCPQTKNHCLTECFLCTGKSMNSAFSGMNLSNAQICNAQKIQEKYEQEVLSIEEKIQCEKEKLSELEDDCSSKSAIKKQKKLIKELEKTKKKICKCYEDEFKTTLSSDQERIYNKNTK